MDNIEKKSWDEFRETGLFLFINSILHVFGWCLVVEVDNETSLVTICYPARTKFRGFREEDQVECYKRIGNYLKDNAEQIAEESNS